MKGVGMNISVLLLCLLSLALGIAFCWQMLNLSMNALVVIIPIISLNFALCLLVTANYLSLVCMVAGMVAYTTRHIQARLAKTKVMSERMSPQSSHNEDDPSVLKVVAQRARRMRGDPYP